MFVRNQTFYQFHFTLRRFLQFLVHWVNACIVIVVVIAVAIIIIINMRQLLRHCKMGDRDNGGLHTARQLYDQTSACVCYLVSSNLMNFIALL